MYHGNGDDRVDGFVTAVYGWLLEHFGGATHCLERLCEHGAFGSKHKICQFLVGSTAVRGQTHVQQSVPHHAVVC